MQTILWEMCPVLNENTATVIRGNGLLRAVILWGNRATPMYPLRGLFLPLTGSDCIRTLWKGSLQSMKNTENTENVFLYLSLDHVCLLLCAARSCSKRSLAQREVLREFSCCRKRTVEAGMSRREQSLLCWPTESVALCYLTDLGEGKLRG